MSIITNLSGFTLDTQNRTVSITPGWSFVNNGQTLSGSLATSLQKAGNLDTVTNTISSDISSISASIITISNNIQTFSGAAISAMASFSGVIHQDSQNMSSSFNTKFNTLQTGLQDRLLTLSQAIITSSVSQGASFTCLNQSGTNLNLLGYSLNVPNGGNISLASTNITSTSATVTMLCNAAG